MLQPAKMRNLVNQMSRFSSWIFQQTMSDYPRVDPFRLQTILFSDPISSSVDQLGQDKSTITPKLLGQLHHFVG